MEENSNVANGMEVIYDFGFAEHDGRVLENTLTTGDPSPSLSGEDDNKGTGSEEQQVDNDSSVNALETTGNDEVTEPDVEEDVTSITTLESICEDGGASKDEVSDETDGFSLRKLAGTSRDIPRVDMLGNVYDATKKKQTAASTSSPAQPGPGILRNMSSDVLPPKQQTEGAPATKGDDLPQSFKVKYLGQVDARGLWGIKHTRRPVDDMVAAAKNLKAGTVLPIIDLIVSKQGVSIAQVQKKVEHVLKFFPIDTISYGVQDVVYTRVFAMIVVREVGDLKEQHPFECHAFVCESRNGAKKLTYALASAFSEYSQLVKERSGGSDGKDELAVAKKKFAIDLRSPEEIAAEMNSPQAEDSEA
jgi:hypothetical protein